jgi:hypothetical protein
LKQKVKALEEAEDEDTNDDKLEAEEDYNVFTGAYHEFSTEIRDQTPPERGLGFERREVVLVSCKGPEMRSTPGEERRRKGFRKEG